MSKFDKSDLVQLNLKDSIKIIIAFVYVNLCCCKRIKKTDDVINRDYGNLYKIFMQGVNKIDKDLNIINVLNRLRFYQVSLLDVMQPEDVWQTYYNDYNIIDLTKSNIDSDDQDNDGENQKEHRI